MRAIVTGQVGVDKGPYLEAVKAAAQKAGKDLVVCHVGHGTLMRALTSGCAVVACPAAGDMNENAARLDWSGAGVRLPRRLITPTGLRLAVQRALTEPSLRARSRELAAWAAARDPGDRAAELVEGLHKT